MRDEVLERRNDAVLFVERPVALESAHGGYAHARVETSATGGALRLTDDDENRDGWLLGAGIERLLLHNISGRLEYFYSDLGAGDGAYDRHRVLAGIAYRF